MKKNLPRSGKSPALSYLDPVYLSTLPIFPIPCSLSIYLSAYVNLVGHFVEFYKTLRRRMWYFFLISTKVFGVAAAGQRKMLLSRLRTAFPINLIHHQILLMNGSMHIYEENIIYKTNKLSYFYFFAYLHTPPLHPIHPHIAMTHTNTVTERSMYVYGICSSKDCVCVK